jgi:hypothetical protein
MLHDMEQDRGAPPDGWEQMPTVELGGLGSARELADLASIFQDLGFVVGCCDRLLDLLASSDRDPVLTEALWSAALVAYVRCFGSGKRVGLDPTIVEQVGLQGDVKDWHQYLRDMRDKHVAHSVNPFETVLVGAVLTPPDKEDRKVEGIATLASKLITSDKQGVYQLGQLAKALRAKVGNSCRASREKVQAEAEMLDVAKLYAYPPLRIYAPRNEQAGKPRPV